LFEKFVRKNVDEIDTRIPNNFDFDFTQKNYFIFFRLLVIAAGKFSKKRKAEVKKRISKEGKNGIRILS